MLKRGTGAGFSGQKRATPPAAGLDKRSQRRARWMGPADQRAELWEPTIVTVGLPRSARPCATLLTVRTARTVHGRRRGIEAPRLNRPPDTLDDALRAVDLLRVGPYLVPIDLGRLGLRDDGELQLDGPAIRDGLGQLVVQQELAGGILDLLLAPPASGRLEVRQG